MKKTAFVLPLFAFVVTFLFGPQNARGDDGNPADALTIVSQTDHGMLCKLEGQRDVLFIEGTAEEMGAAHGELMTEGIDSLANIIGAVALAYTAEKKVSFEDQIKEAQNRCRPFTPKRFIREMNAMAETSGQKPSTIRKINFFPEMFHCTGVAVRGPMTVDGNVRHARVLDYMKDIGLQEYAVLMVFMPSEKLDGKPLNAWISVSYPGFLGTVTCMNEKGLAMGEMGGGGVGQWDGLSMTFLMRRVMEECSTVQEALDLIQSTPLTCTYYYVLSDASNDIAAVVTEAGTDHPVHIVLPNEDYPDWMPNKSVMPKKYPDAVFVSGRGERINALSQRLDEYTADGKKIDSQAMMEIVKRPVCMKENLHDAIFEPATGDFYFAEAQGDEIGANSKYFKGNIAKFIEFYKANKKK
ncbi:MAG: hypothetical protein IJG02_03755 [Thermoguttaceae bacterium]|nr:hypothetical protein [Thermoguttaceae bacterium]